jgi:hypothetical protein
VAYAGIPEQVDEFMKAHALKAGVLYDIKEGELIETVGATIVENVKEVKNLDLDLLISSYNSEIQSDDEKAIGLGLSYNYDLTKNFGISAGLGATLERFEKIEENRLGELHAGIYVLISGKF